MSREASVALMRLESVDLTPVIGGIRVQGEVDSSNVTQLKDAFDRFFQKGVYRVVVNLSQAKYISSSGVGCVVGAYTTAVKNGGRVVFSGAPLQILEVFRVIGLAEILRFTKDEPAAIALVAKDA